MAVEYDSPLESSFLEAEATARFHKSTSPGQDILWCKKWVMETMHKDPIRDILCSLHPNLLSYQKFVEQYWDSMPDTDRGESVPDSYVSPDDTPLFLCKVSPALYQRIVNTEIGMWSTTIPRSTIDAISIIPEKELTSLIEGRQET